MKTIKEWLQELPEELGEKALGYTHEELLDIEISSLRGALYGAFAWEETPEGELLDIEISSLRGALYGAFAWEETPEGHTYWCNIKME